MNEHSFANRVEFAYGMPRCFEFVSDRTDVHLKDSHSGACDSYPLHVVVRGDDEIPGGISIGASFAPSILISCSSSFP